MDEQLQKQIGLNKHHNNQDEMFELCKQHLRGLTSRFDSLYSRKAVEFAHGKVFCRQRDDLYIFYLVEMLPKKMYCNFTHIALKRVKTNSGQMFLLYQGGKGQVCLTAHFFDRYAERILGTKDRSSTYAAREEAIKDWGKNYIKGHIAGVVTRLKPDRTLEIPHPKGYCLGELQEDDKTMVVKTFVSEDMLRSNQSKTRDSLIAMRVDNRTHDERVKDYYEADRAERLL